MKSRRCLRTQSMITSQERTHGNVVGLPNNEGKEEDQEGPAPLHVDECGIQVLEVTRPSLLQVREGDVAVAVLPDDVFAHARPEQPCVRTRSY